MTNLRHLVFLEKKLVSIEDKDGRILNISNIVDVAGDDHFLFLLESSGIVWMCYRPWVKFDKTTHLRFTYFKSFDIESRNLFYSPVKHILIVTGREQESDSMLKFNSYDLSYLINGGSIDQVPQLIQSTPMFPNMNEFRPQSNINISISECLSLVAISTEFNGIYIYKNYIIPYEDQKLWTISTSKLFEDPSVSIKNIHIFKVGPVFYMFILTEYEVLSYNLTENFVVFRESSETKFEASCKLKNNLVGVYKPSKIIVYSVLNGLHKYIYTSNPGGQDNDVNQVNSDKNTNLHCYNEYVINCNIDNIYDNNNIVLINVYSYLLDVTFIAYSYYIPRLTYVLQSMNNLYLFTTNTFTNSTYSDNKVTNNSKSSKDKSKDNSNILIFELKNKKIYERIEILMRKRLFGWAIKLAKFERRPKSEIEEIYKIYGDWLYSKNKYEMAIRCYCRSGSSVEPCYVIQRFLVLNSKLYLYKYLYHLHLNNKDNYILTILLIQSLNHLSPLEGKRFIDEISVYDKKFLENESLEAKELSEDDLGEELGVLELRNSLLNGDNEGPSLGGFHTENEKVIEGIKELYKFLNKFGVSHKSSIKESIIECRKNNRYEFASLIAKFQGDDEEYLNILIEDLNEFDRAYELLEKVDNEIKYKVIIKHHKLLLSYDPSKLLKLISSLLYNCQSPITSMDNTDPNNDVGLNSCEEENLKINNILNTFILENNFLIKLLNVINTNNNSLLFYTIKLNILLQQYQDFMDNSNSPKVAITNESNAVNSQYLDNYNLGNSDLYKSNNFDSLYDNNKKDDYVVDEKQKLEDKILKLLNTNNDKNYELVSLVLCLLYNYKRGSIVISIKMGYYNLPLILLDNENENINLLEYVFNYGYNEPILYLNILKLLLKHKNYTIIKKLLYNIQNYKLLKYQNIINIFNNYQNIEFQYIHDYIMNEFKKINDVIQEYNNDIRQDKMEYMNMKKNLVNLNNNYIIINNSNCSSCGLHLEYPSIHFYCKHSYHIYCITQDNLCPKCSYNTQGSEEPKFTKSYLHNINIQDNIDNDDNFFKFLIGSNDPFDYISQQFNKFLNI